MPSTGKAPPGRDPRTEIRGAGQSSLAARAPVWGPPFSPTVASTLTLSTTALERVSLPAEHGSWPCRVPAVRPVQRTDKGGTAGPCAHCALSCGGLWVRFTHRRSVVVPRSKGTRGTQPGWGTSRGTRPAGKVLKEEGG